MSLEILKEAIEKKMPISFEYNKPGKTPGERFGNPYVIYVMRKNDGSESTKIDIVQTDGVSDSKRGFPCFGIFDLAELSNIKIETNKMPFEISEQYNPESDRYRFVIAKV